MATKQYEGISCFEFHLVHSMGLLRILCLPWIWKLNVQNLTLVKIICRDIILWQFLDTYICPFQLDLQLQKISGLVHFRPRKLVYQRWECTRWCKTISHDWKGESKVGIQNTMQCRSHIPFSKSISSHLHYIWDRRLQISSPEIQPQINSTKRHFLDSSS